MARDDAAQAWARATADLIHVSTVAGARTSQIMHALIDAGVLPDQWTAVALSVVLNGVIRHLVTLDEPEREAGAAPPRHLH